MMQEKGGGGGGRRHECVCVGGIAFSIFVLESAVRACVCVDGEGSFWVG